MASDAQCIVVGAGIIGLAVARALQLGGIETFLIDQEAGIGMHTSSRNSEVIHAGIYYKAGSLKAKHCVQGRHLLYQYCRERHVPHSQVGKIIVAVTEDEEFILDKYMISAKKNGVDDLTLVDKAFVLKLEPDIICQSAIISPSTGIIDSHRYMLSLLGDFESAGGHFIRSCRLERIELSSSVLYVHIGEDTPVSARWVINSAGLFAPNIAATIEGFPPALLPEAHYAIGHYYTLAGKSPFTHLVYPIARAGGLGVHVTLDLGGAAKFGPDVDWIDQIDYSFDNSRHAKFVDAIRAYYPGLDPEKLVPAYTGIRPKLGGPNSPDADFVIQGPLEHGIPGLVNLFGIESPGLTSSLSLASAVAEIVQETDTVKPFQSEILEL